MNIHTLQANVVRRLFASREQDLLDLQAALVAEFKAAGLETRPLNFHGSSDVAKRLLALPLGTPSQARFIVSAEHSPSGKFSCRMDIDVETANRRYEQLKTGSYSSTMKADDAAAKKLLTKLRNSPSLKSMKVVPGTLYIKGTSVKLNNPCDVTYTFTFTPEDSGSKSSAVKGKWAVEVKDSDGKWVRFTGDEHRLSFNSRDEAVDGVGVILHRLEYDDDFGYHPQTRVVQI